MNKTKTIHVVFAEGIGTCDYCLSPVTILKEGRGSHESGS